MARSSGPKQILGGRSGCLATLTGRPGRSRHHPTEIVDKHLQDNGIQLKEVLKKRPDLQQLQEERSEASQDSTLAEVAEGKASAEDEGEEEEGEEDWEGEEGDEELLA